jgi:hypothetical protein
MFPVPPPSPSTFNKSKAAPPPEAKHWDPTTFRPPETRSRPKTEEHIPVPAVPDSSGRGRTAVHIPSLNLFADNMEKLAEPVKKAYDRLAQQQMVHPGTFYDAYQLRSAASGANGDGGIQNTYLKILHDLGKGLHDLSTGMRSLSKTYTNTEEQAKMKADDLQKALSPAQGDFGKISSGG